VRGTPVLPASPAPRLIVAGFSLLLFATLLDITDEIPGLERYAVIGATQSKHLSRRSSVTWRFYHSVIGFIKSSLDARIDEVGQELHESEEKFRSVYETIRT